MNLPKISVIMPVYNGQKTLAECLNSVLLQTYPNYEVIVVDNNSTDQTKEIIKAYQPTGRVKYLFEPNHSRSAAYNTGVKSAVGEIIVFTHADCLLSPKWLEQLVWPIIIGQEKAVLGFVTDLEKNFWTKNIQRADQSFYQRNRRDKYISMIDTRNFAIMAGLIREAMFDSEIVSFEDFDLYLRLKKFIKIRFLPNVTVGHWHRSNFISVVESYFQRAYWSARIYLKYRGRDDLSDVNMFESISVFNFLTLPAWLALNFFTKGIGYASFLVVTEIAWRLGLFWGLIKRGKT